MKVRFYYFRDQKRTPIVTVCLIKNGTKISRGIAICSKKDMPAKKIGRKIALARARKAFGIQKSTEAIKMLRTRKIFEEAEIYTQFKYKSEYLPDLTHYETQILF